MEIFGNIQLGLSVAFSTTNLLYCMMGVILGTFIGVIPGVGAITAISMLLPVTYYLELTTALIMLGGIWYGATYGGAITSILLNIPGTPANAVTCLEGHPMARQGRAGVALLAAALASFVGGSIGILLLMMFAPVIARYALVFGPAEYFALMTMALVATATVSYGSIAKGLAMVVLGVLFGTVGADIYTGIPRFTFGAVPLMDGISLVALAMGIFGVSEIIATVRNQSRDALAGDMRLNAMKPTRDELKRSAGPVLRGSGIGALLGALPGTGPAIAAFVSYAMEKRLSSHSEKFGNGAIEGVVAPESANNSADQTAFIPTLSLGVPGSPTMALMLGAMMIHGVAAGPNLVTEQAPLFWGLIMSFWIGNVMLVILNVPLIGLWVRLLSIPYHLLFPSILVFICIGAYAVSQSAFEVWMVVLFGFVGFAMRIFDWPSAPLLLGFVLGPMLEEHFRRALLISRGSLQIFIDRPVSATIITLTVAMLLWSFWAQKRARLRMSS